MRYLPVFMDVAGRRCLVVGGGEVALRKIELLRRAGARIEVVAPELHPKLASLAESGALAWQRRRFAVADIADAALVFAATGDARVDEAVAAAAVGARVPVDAVDRPEVSSFITPAIVDRDPVVIGISSGGTAPVLARRIRADIEALLPARLGALARFAGRFRAAVKTALDAGPAPRRRFWEQFFAGPVARQVLDGDELGAAERMTALIERAESAAAAGSVAIVGAGPGAADLLTLRALQALQAADAVVYDRLVGPQILDYARRDAELILVGKARGAASATQDDINALLARLALAGKRVVRLKGGDPFVFGRGGEERAFLASFGIAVELVPGITAATGCGAAAGIPLTQRGIASAVTLVTGHGADGAANIDWAVLAKLGHTLVVYMGVSEAAEIARRLIAHGSDPQTPVAVIENGTRADQRTVIGRLGGLGALVRDNAIGGPAVIVVGEVVREAAAARVPAARALALAG